MEHITEGLVEITRLCVSSNLIDANSASDNQQERSYLVIALAGLKSHLVSLILELSSLFAIIKLAMFGKKACATR